MKESDIFIEVDCFQKNKAGNIVCGDSYMSQKLKEEDRITGLHPGMREMLAAMKMAGLWSAIATGKSRAGLARVLSKTSSESYFCASRTMDEAQSKPSPDMLRQLSDE